MGQSDTHIGTLDQFEFHHTMSEMSGSVIVIFTGPACGSCKAWKKLLKEFKRLNPDVRLFEVDVEQDQALATEFSVFHLPALFLYRDGNYHGEIECEASLSALDSTLTELLRQSPQEMP